MLVKRPSTGVRRSGVGLLRAGGRTGRASTDVGRRHSLDCYGHGQAMRETVCLERKNGVIAVVLIYAKEEGRVA